MTLESAENKVQELCQILQNETLLPAKEEAQRIVAEAQAEAESIIVKANEDADEILKSLKKDLEKTKSISDTSIELAIKQGILRLKQLIMEIFNEEILALTDAKMKDADVMAKLIESLIGAIDKDGIDSDLSVVIGRDVEKEALISALTGQFQERIENGGVHIGQFKAGIAVKIIDEKVSLEFTDQTVVELISMYISGDLKEKIFNAS